MHGKRYFIQTILALTALLLAGCVTTPYEGEGKARSDARLRHQFESAEQHRQAKPEGRIIFAGFAMHSQSKAFRNDVVAAEKAMRVIDPNAIIFKLDNPAWGQDAVWPYATPENFARVLRQVGAMARTQDKIVLLISTHGAPDVLAVNFDNKDYPHINAKWLNQSLAPLGAHPTLLLISACYSGSFVEPLASPNRVILTSAAKDRNSFGCHFHSDNTFFVDALLNQAFPMSLSIAQLMERAKIAIDRRERGMKLSPPSSPQIFVGGAVKEWSEQRLDAWLKTP